MNHELKLEPNITAADHFYQLLIDTHEGLSEADSQAVNARLILILANHIGDGAVLAQAMRIARGEIVG